MNLIARMEETDPLTDAFNKLQSNYILITIHDVKDYPLPQLTALAQRLENQLTLDPPLEAIHLQLVERSDQNVKDKKRKKEEKKKMAAQSKALDQSSGNLLGELNSTAEQSLSYEEDRELAKFNKIQTIGGTIYDGKMFFVVEVATHAEGPRSKMGFVVSGEAKRSLVSRKSLEMLKAGRQEGKKVELWVEGRAHRFEVGGLEEEDVLGLDFLTSHNVISTCNYRQQCFKCSLAFTE